MSGGREEEEPVGTAEAARWFARLQDEAATGGDWLAFEQWLGAAPENAAAYEKLEGIWVDLDGAGETVAAALDGSVSLAAHRYAQGRPSRRGWLAAGVGLAASLVAGLFATANWPAPTETYLTTPGQTRQVELADGSKVWINAGSRLEVRLGRREREVRMAEGEAVFDVTHDPGRPFRIDTGDREVRVVGTAFDVRQRGDAFALSVVRGTVEVRPSGRPTAAPARIAAGMRLTHRRGAALSQVAPGGAEAALAWTRGQLVYEAAPLSEVAADLSRSLGRPVRVADAATGRILFTGVLALDDPDAIPRRLEAFAPVRAERRDGALTLGRR